MSRQRKFPLTDIYGITASEYSRGRTNQQVVKQMLEVGVKVVQYREKEFTMLRKYQECLYIRQLCTEYGACFMVNDDVDLAIAVGADGIHVGQDDLPVEKVRELVGGEMLIGLSITDTEQLHRAIKSGVVDYLGVGPIFETATKKVVCVPVGLEFLDYVAQHCQIPVVAIGGIKESNVAEVVRHGVTCVAMISEIVGAEDIGSKVRAIRKVMSEARGFK